MNIEDKDNTQSEAPVVTGRLIITVEEHILLLPDNHAVSALAAQFHFELTPPETPVEPTLTPGVAHFSTLARSAAVFQDAIAQAINYIQKHCGGEVLGERVMPAGPDNAPPDVTGFIKDALAKHAAQAPEAETDAEAPEYVM